MSEYDVDLAVVGSGGAAMSAAIAASLEGKTVLLVERGTLGGTCVNIGCVPSKTLLAAASRRHAAETNPFDGAPTSAGPVDLRALVRQKDELIERLRGAKYADVAAAYGFEILPGQATFVDGETLSVDGRPVGEIAPQEVARTRFAQDVATLAQMDGSSFYRRLREKFGRLSR